MVILLKIMILMITTMMMMTEMMMMMISILTISKIMVTIFQVTILHHLCVALIFTICIKELSILDHVIHLFAMMMMMMMMMIVMMLLMNMIIMLITDHEAIILTSSNFPFEISRNNSVLCVWTVPAKSRIRTVETWNENNSDDDRDYDEK